MNSLAPYLNDIVERLTWTNTCKAGTFILGAHMIHIGLWAYISPRSLTETHGLRFDGQPLSSVSAVNPPKYNQEIQAASLAKSKQGQNDETKNFWPLLFAPREVGFGLLTLLLGGLGEWRAAGIVVGIIAAVLATTDGVVTAYYATEGWHGAFKSHGIPAIALGGMAMVLLQK